MNPTNPRSRSRGWALQVLYAWEQGPEGDTLPESARRTLSRRRVSPRYVEYLDRLLAWIDEEGDSIDRTLRRHLENWRLERLTAIDRNIMRIAVAELLHSDDVPPAVAIHEAMQLARKYGSDESPRFVNGVLDAVAGSLRTAG
ncbi:MAG: transcription antitermination factor NusB [Gemmatimonadota bacterium]